MNFIGRMEGSEVRVELKYCERCGGLFLRQPGEDRAYCVLCMVHFAQRLESEEKQNSVSPRKARKRRAVLGRAGQIGCLRGVAAVEVRA